MPTAAELLGQQGQLQAVLDAGVEALSVRQTVTFTLYTFLAVASDGFGFWIASSTQATVVGALHYSTDLLQDEDQTAAANQVILTAEAEVTEFNLTAPGQLWIGAWPVAGGAATLQVAFSSRGDYFGPANLWHYRGIAVLPVMAAQILASPADLPSGPIVSNSLPIWLAQGTTALPVYPSFLVPQNARAPYVVAHVEPDGTEAIQAFPDLTGWPAPPIPLNPTLYNLASQQLCRDRVRLTLYGLNNQAAQQFLYGLIEYSRDTDAFGFGSNPVIRDEKRTQREIMAIAQKKTITLSVSYYQGAANVAARRMIVQAFVTTNPGSVLGPLRSDSGLPILSDSGQPISIV